MMNPRLWGSILLVVVGAPLAVMAIYWITYVIFVATGLNGSLPLWQ